MKQQRQGRGEVVVKCSYCVLTKGIPFVPDCQFDALSENTDGDARLFGFYGNKSALPIFKVNPSKYVLFQMLPGWGWHRYGHCQYPLNCSSIIFGK